MNGPGHRHARVWMPVAIVILIAGHGFILYYVSSHLALSSAAIAGLIVLVLFKHLGWLASLYALFLRRPR